MKYIRIFSVACCAMLLLSCNNTSSSNDKTSAPVANSNDVTDNSTTATMGNPAVFSYYLDGVKISGGVTDITPFNNSAQIVQGDKGKRLQFFLNDGGKENAETFPHSLRFVIPGNTGTVQLTADEPDWNAGLFVAESDDGKYIFYSNESFTITVTTITDSHVTGTFSGKLKSADGQTGQKNEVTVTDGSFDIPVHK